MIVNDYIKLTLAEGGVYEKGNYIGDRTCIIEDNKVVISPSTETELYSLPGYVRVFRYHGYLSGNSIVMVDAENNIVSSYTPDDVTTEIELEVPDECSVIYIPCQKAYSSSYYVQAFVTGYYDVTQYVDNWDNIEMVMSRDKTSGVINEVSFDFEFVESARAFLMDVFNRNGLYSNVLFSVYKREDKGNEYALIKDMMLDFSSYQLTKDRVKISSSNNTLAEIINSEGKTEFEIPVSEICEEKKWDYSRIKVLNNAVYQVADFTLEGGVKGFVAPAIITTSVELAPGANKVDFVEQRLSYPSETDYFPTYLLKNVSTDLINFKVRLKAKITCSYSGTQTGVQMRFSTMSIFGAITWVEMNPTSTSVVDGVVTHTFDMDELETYYVLPGRAFQLCFYFPEEVQNPAFKVEQDEFMIYYSHESENRDIDVINPTKLMQRYLDEMSGVNGLYRAVINWDNEPYETMIVAADSIRQLEGARIYGKPNDFFDWMRVLGYEYSIDGNTLEFKKRDEYYRDTLSLSMAEDEVADLIIQADSEYAYTSVEIGYEKQDYDSVNGRLEVNGTFSYTTGYVTREDNKLSLISPYRADSIGIEFLAQDADKKTTDKESDNDVFFVALVEGEKYTEYKDLIIRDDNYDIEFFNAVFAPNYLVERNKSLIGINAKELKFKATNMSTTGHIVQGEELISPYTDIPLDGGLFDPVIYNFAAGSHKDMPMVRDGLVSFVWEGETYQGYIKEIRKNYAKETETTWELFAVLPGMADAILFGIISENISSFGDITSKMVSGFSKISSMEETEISFKQGDKVVILVTSEAQKDSGFGALVPFDESVQGANGQYTITIKDKEYKVFGEMMLVSGKIKVTVS